MWVAFAKAHIFPAKMLAYMRVFNDQIFNDTLNNDIVSFEQLGPDQYVHFLQDTRKSSQIVLFKC